MTKNNFRTISGLYELDSLQANEIYQILVETYKVNPGGRCFAENILAEQFVENSDGVISKINLESGEVEYVCSVLDELESTVGSGDNSNYFLANSLKEGWEINNKQVLKNNVKLLPIVPFVAGGAFDSGNLHPVDRKKAISFLVDFYKNTKDLPNDSSFEFKISK